MFLTKFFNVMSTIEEEKVIEAFGAKILSLKAKLVILNKFAIIPQLN